MWSNDAGNSLIVAENYISMQKITPSLDNCFYITWQKAGDSGYSLYIQKVDVNGNILWPKESPSVDGILVYSRSLMQSSDYSVALDDENNVYIGIDSGFISSEGVALLGGKAVACKVSSEGDLLFGSSGIVISDAEDIISPHVLAVTASDGNILFSWGVTNKVGYVDIIETVKTDTQGQIIWRSRMAKLPLKDYYTPISLQPSANGSVVLSYLYTSATNDGRVFTCDFKANKLSGDDGTPLWNITGDGSVNIYTHPDNARGITSGVTPAVLPDNIGGLYFATPALDTDTGKQVIYLQRINSDGVLKFTGNGIKVTDETTKSQSMPVLSLDFEMQGVYILFNVSVVKGIPGQMYNAAVAQYFDNEGNKQWGDNGITLDDYTYPEGNNGIPISMLAYDGAVLAVWLPAVAPDQIDDSPIRTSLIDLNGVFIWKSKFVDVKTNATDSVHPDATVNADHVFSVISWVDYTGDISESLLRAQNITKDGILGA